MQRGQVGGTGGGQVGGTGGGQEGWGVARSYCWE